MGTFLRDNWLWILGPIVLVVALVIVVILMGGDDSDFVYPIF